MGAHRRPRRPRPPVQHPRGRRPRVAPAIARVTSCDPHFIYVSQSHSESLHLLTASPRALSASRAAFYFVTVISTLTSTSEHRPPPPLPPADRRARTTHRRRFTGLAGGHNGGRPTGPPRRQGAGTQRAGDAALAASLPSPFIHSSCCPPAPARLHRCELLIGLAPRARRPPNTHRRAPPGSTGLPPPPPPTPPPDSRRREHAESTRTASPCSRCPRRRRTRRRHHGPAAGLPGRAHRPARAALPARCDRAITRPPVARRHALAVYLFFSLIILSNSTFPSIFITISFILISIIYSSHFFNFFIFVHLYFSNHLPPHGACPFTLGRSAGCCAVDITGALSATRTLRRRAEGRPHMSML